MGEINSQPPFKPTLLWPFVTAKMAPYLSHSFSVDSPVRHAVLSIPRSTLLSPDFGAVSRIATPGLT
jgi:hypothetical protein